jgi:hypothetical protein
MSDSRQNLLARVRLWTIFVSLVVGGALAFAVSFAFGLGVFLTALWAVAGLWSLEMLLRSAVVPPGAPRNGFAVFLWATAKLAVYGVALWVLFSRPLPPLSHAVGFTLLMVILVVLGAQARSAEIRLSERREEDGPTAR